MFGIREGDGRCRRVVVAVAMVGAIALSGCDELPTPSKYLSSTYDGKIVTEGSIAVDYGTLRGSYRDPLADGNGAYAAWYGRYSVPGSCDVAIRYSIGCTRASSGLRKEATISNADGRRTFAYDVKVEPGPGRMHGYLNVCAQMGFPVKDVCTEGDAIKDW